MADTSSDNSIYVIPSITVIMPAYNAARFFDESVPSILNQTFRDFEFIIVDDCSTDNTPATIKKYADADPRIIYIRNKTRLDHLESRNVALRMARGIYAAELDADDISLPNRLQAQYDYCQAHPDLVLIGGGVEVIDAQGRTIGHKRPSDNLNMIRFRLLLRNSFVHSAMFYKKDVIEKAGGYDPDYLHAEDYELYWRLLGRGHLIGNVPEPIIKYRAHNQSISTVSGTQKIQQENAYKICYDALNRYVPVTMEDAKTFFDVIHKKNLGMVSAFRTIFFYKRLTASYLERENISSTERAEIWNAYKADKEMILGRAVRSRLPFLYKMTKKTYRKLIN